MATPTKAKCFAELNSFAIMTLGCKVNSYESNLIANELLSYGLTQLDFDQVADLYIINTCSVTNAADAKSKNMISRAVRTNPNAIILVCGCYSQVSQEVQADLHIDIVLGNKYKSAIYPVLNEYFQNQHRLVKVDNLLLERKFEESRAQHFEHQTRAFLKIQDGCNFMCSYCIIPFSRGRQRSKAHVAILSEIQELVQNGYKEIVLTGVNTAGYDDGECNFYQLLQAIDQLPGAFRVRISSVEPFQISDQIVNLLTHNKQRWCQHWHICLQSGDDSVLQRMNRKYTTAQFKALIDKIRERSPNAAITTDYICGFPTETDVEHTNALKFLAKINFAKIHVFPYSKRDFTRAAKLPQVHDQTKKDRVNAVLQISERGERQFIKSFVGKTVHVLFEQMEGGHYWSGHSGEFFKVLVPSTQNLKNQLLPVKIQKVVLDQAFGELSLEDEWTTKP